MSNKKDAIKHSLAVASNSKVLQFKNDKNILRKEYRQTCLSLTKVATDIITLQAHTNSQMTHQRSFALVSNLNKINQQLAKTVPPGSEQQIFGHDLRKRIEGIGNNKQFFERENAYYSNKKNSKGFLKPWKPLLEIVPTTPKQQKLQQSPGQSLQPKGEIPKEAKLSVGTINIEERQHCVNFIGKLKIMKTGKSTPKISIFLAQPRRT